MSLASSCICLLEEHFNSSVQLFSFVFLSKLIEKRTVFDDDYLINKNPVEELFLKNKQKILNYLNYDLIPDLTAVSKIVYNFMDRIYTHVNIQAELPNPAIMPSQFVDNFIKKILYYSNNGDEISQILSICNKTIDLSKDDHKTEANNKYDLKSTADAQAELNISIVANRKNTISERKSTLRKTSINSGLKSIFEEPPPKETLITCLLNFLESNEGIALLLKKSEKYVIRVLIPLYVRKIIN